MTGMKRIRVREAKPRDIGLFKKLWIKLLADQNSKGSLIKANDVNLDVATNLFKMYVDSEISGEFQREGVVLFVSDVAVLMWGDMGPNFQLEIGDKIAYGWGIYIEPEHRGKGISDQLQAEAIKKLSEMGFDAMLGSTLVNDSHGHEAWIRGTKHVGEPKPTGDRPCYLKFKE